MYNYCTQEEIWKDITFPNDNDTVTEGETFDFIYYCSNFCLYNISQYGTEMYNLKQIYSVWTDFLRFIWLYTFHVI